jgi:hypothetical protein
MRAFFGNTLMAVGALMALLPGLCAGIILLFGVATMGQNDLWNAVSQPFLAMGAPIGVGGVLVVVGRAVAGMKPERWAGVLAAVLGAMITGATAPIIWSQVFTPGPIVGLAVDMGPMAPIDTLAGLLLIASAFIEFRRKPSRPA